MIPFLTVLVTWLPTKKAPANSKKAAMRTARFRVSALELTTVAIELATSLAPILQAE
jgi:hypothetical protein